MLYVLKPITIILQAHEIYLIKPMVTIYVKKHYSFFQNPWQTYITPMENYDYLS